MFFVCSLDQIHILQLLSFLVITKRRIGKSMPTIQDAINNCDIVSLPAEHAELLLKLLPTKDEVVLSFSVSHMFCVKYQLNSIRLFCLSHFLPRWCVFLQSIEVPI